MATDAPVTVYQTISDIYPTESVLSQGQRWSNLTTRYTEEFKGAKPSAIVRAPGRINLIGEHIDYCLFGVMPAAVEMDCLIALGPHSSSSSSNPTSTNKSTTNPASTSQADTEDEDESCRLVITNLDPSWPGATITARRSAHEQGQGSTPGRWEVSGGTGKRGDWVAYLSSALDCVLNKFFSSGQTNASSPRSLDLMITGSIPPGSGLSSSAALIVASLLSILLGNEIISSSATTTTDNQATRPQVTNADLVQMAREAEAKIGVNSGGMDQSASVLSRAGQGLYVSFAPELGVENVKLPDVRTEEDGSEEPLVMVITNSLTRHDLSRGAEKEYNLRVMETLIGARILGHKLGLLSDNKEDDHRLQLRTVLGRFGGETKTKVLSADELERAISLILPEVDNHLGSPQGLLPTELATLMGMSEDESTAFQGQMKVNTSDQQGRFRVQMRVKHVFEEAQRVLAVRRICLESTNKGGSSSSSSSIGSGESNVQEIGRLMNESHESCAELYECSNSELNELVRVCREAGSVGSRLSGAGWGGCVVSLIPKSREASFIEYITDAQTGYEGYKRFRAEQEGKVQSGEKGLFKDVVFKTIPGSGAGVMRIE